MREVKQETGEIPMKINARLLNVSLFALALASATHVLANPTGGTVASGSATFASTGTTLTVTNAPNTIINWQGFSIGAGETTRFVQQSSASAVLNRVTTQSASSIRGSLLSNGRVFLVNPNGILFGSGAQVNTAMFTATTGNISDSAFLSGNATPSGAGSTLNFDGLMTVTGGNLTLGTNGVDNDSNISFAGQQVTFDANTIHVTGAITTAGNLALNTTNGGVGISNPIGPVTGAVTISGGDTDTKRIAVPTTAITIASNIALVTRAPLTVAATVAAAVAPAGKTAVQRAATAVSVGVNLQKREPFF